jgi:hypothetical protein
VSTVKKPARKRAPKAAKGGHAPATHEQGSETMGGMQIPFLRVSQEGDYVVTFYGSNEGIVKTALSLLVKHERRGAVSWGINVDDSMLQSGLYTKRLQGIWKTSEGRDLAYAVAFVRQFPEAYEEEWPYGSGRRIRDAVKHAITSGNRHLLDVIAKCVEADATRPTTTFNERIVEAIRCCANAINRIPTKAEVQKWFERTCKEIQDDGNFSRRLDEIGFGWLPTCL